MLIHHTDLAGNKINIEGKNLVDCYQKLFEARGITELKDLNPIDIECHFYDYNTLPIPLSNPVANPPV